MFQALCQAQGPPWVLKGLSLVKIKVQNVPGATQQGGSPFLHGEGCGRGRAGRRPPTRGCVGHRSYNAELFHTLLGLLASFGSVLMVTSCLPAQSHGDRHLGHGSSSPRSQERAGQEVVSIPVSHSGSSTCPRRIQAWGQRPLAIPCPGNVIQKFSSKRAVSVGNTPSWGGKK